MADVSAFDVPFLFGEIDGFAVLGRIIDNGGRIRTDVINDSMAEAAEVHARAILARTDIDAHARAVITRVQQRLVKVIAARRRVRGLS
jgi:hypothetical protein